MDKLKQYVVFTALGCVLVLAAGWFLLVSPKQSQAADLRTQAASQVTANAQLETQLSVLKAQAKDLPKKQAELAAIAMQIPDNPALPGLIRSLTTAAKASGVELVSVTPSQPTAVAAAAGAPAAPAAPAATRPGAVTSAAGAASAGQLQQIAVTLNVAGGYFQTEAFVAALENLPRAMRLNNLTLAPGSNPVKPQTAGTVGDGKTLTTTITGAVFMAANRPATTAVTVPGQTTAAGPVTTAKK